MSEINRDAERLQLWEAAVQRNVAAGHEEDRAKALTRPFMLMLGSGQLRFFMDGNKWCVLLGESLQDGVAGFGDSPDAASRDFDRAWTENLKKEDA